MTKLAPQERWTKDVLERCQAFGLSSELQRLRGLGLDILGRDRLVTQEEWWEEMNAQGPMGSTEYRAFQTECGKAGTNFGFAPPNLVLEDWPLPRFNFAAQLGSSGLMSQPGKLYPLDWEGDLAQGKWAH